jgi:hypothetical protein
MPANTFVYDLDIDKVNNIIAAGTSKGLFTSTNHGNSWAAVSGITQNDTIRCVKFHYSTLDNPNDKLLAGTTEGEFYSAERTPLGYQTAALLFTFFGSVSDIESNEDLEFLPAVVFPFFQDVISNPGFFYSTNSGANWIQNNNGLPAEPKVSSIACHIFGGSYTIYTGLFENTTSGATIYKYSGLIGIQSVTAEIPGEYFLLQNYPNPFNPATNIEFAVPRISFVRLVVYDMLGREVEILVNKELKAGTYKADWNASKYPGGVYFYRLVTDNFTQTKKMILVK